MPQYRLFLFDRQNHIVSASEMECVESDVKNLALDILRNQPYSVDGVEVWRGSQQLDRIQRV